MRELIKPGLFWVVRLGLFLSVVAWVVGQWWQGVGAVPVLFSAIDQTAIVFAFYPPTHWTSFVAKTPTDDLIETFFDGPGNRPLVLHLNLHVVAFGIGTAGCLGIKHWLNVTIFATFYGVLKFVYRKRGREAVVDE